jgi:hypothetical protein
MTDTYATRRGFLRLLPALGAAVGAAAGLAAWARPARAAGAASTPCHPGALDRPFAGHPDPRPGVDASHVTPRDKIHGDADLARIFDHVREMPKIADGIACRCGCMEDPAIRSLLSCYEGDGMASHCLICQGQAETAYRLFKQGKTLEDVRAALDAEFG